MPDRMLTTGQVAAMTGYCCGTIKKWFDCGMLKGHRSPGRQDRRISYRSVVKMALSLGMDLDEPLPRKKRVR